MGPSCRIPGNGKSIMAIAFSPDGSTLAYFSRQEPLIHVWDFRTRSWKFDLDRPSGTIKLQYTPTGEQLGTRSIDTNFATIWNANGQVVQRYRSKVEFETEMPVLRAVASIGQMRQSIERHMHWCSRRE
jgi:WD40 repeat protein